MYNTLIKDKLDLYSRLGSESPYYPAVRRNDPLIIVYYVASIPNSAN